MIGVWGRGDSKNYATFQITLYLSLGALIALIGLIALYLQLPVDQRTFDIREITDYFRANPMSNSAQHFIFPLLMFGFGFWSRSGRSTPGHARLWLRAHRDGDASCGGAEKSSVSLASFAWRCR